MLVLGVIAAMMITVFVIYPKVDDQQKLQKTKDQIVLIRSSVDSLFAGKNDYSELSNELMINSKELPESMISNGEITNLFNGQIFIEPSDADSSGRDGALVKIIYKRLPQDICIKLIKDLYPNYYLIQAYSSTDEGGDIKRESDEINNKNLMDGCSSDSNVVIFYYK